MKEFFTKIAKMYYAEARVNKILTCEKCNERLDVAKSLPCGSILCSYCAKALDIKDLQFDCPVCTKRHSLDGDDLPVNKRIMSLLEEKPISVSRGKSYEKLNNTLKSIDDYYNQLFNGLTHPSDQIIEYCTQLENEIQLSKEQHLIEIEQYHEQLSSQIKQYKQDCLNNIKSKTSEQKALLESFKPILTDLQRFYEEWNVYLNQPIIEEIEVEQANLDGLKLISKANENISKLDIVLFNDAKLSFVTNNTLKVSADKLIGYLNLDCITGILTSAQVNELYKLSTKNLASSRCSLIYKATLDGFSARTFHSKCDFKDNTLVVIKSENGNIFGGYTGITWNGFGDKIDPCAFLFSLVNKDNEALMIRCKKPLNAIYCEPNFGPTFGNCISPDLQLDYYLNEGSSALGNAYKHPKYAAELSKSENFLAGSTHFKIKDVEVFTFN